MKTRIRGKASARQRAEGIRSSSSGKVKEKEKSHARRVRRILFLRGGSRAGSRYHETKRSDFLARKTGPLSQQGTGAFFIVFYIISQGKTLDKIVKIC